jgi:hypothetical protein
MGRRNMTEKRTKINNPKTVESERRDDDTVALLTRIARAF